MATRNAYVNATPLGQANALPATKCECDRGVVFEFRCCGAMVDGKCCCNPDIHGSECDSCGGTGVRLLFV